MLKSLLSVSVSAGLSGILGGAADTAPPASSVLFSQDITGAAPAEDNTGQVLFVNTDSVAATFWDHVTEDGGNLIVLDGETRLPI